MTTDADRRPVARLEVGMTLRIDPRVRGDHVHLAASLQKKQAAVEEAKQAGNYVRAGDARVELMIFEILFCVEG